MFRRLRARAYTLPGFVEKFSRYRRLLHFLIQSKLKASVICRYFRRYWALSSLPGVYVEEYPDPDLSEDMLRVRVPQKAQSAPSASGYSTPGVSDSSAAGTPVGGRPAPSTPMNGVVVPVSSLPTINVIPPEGRLAEGSPLLRNVLTPTVNGQSHQSEERPLVEALTQGKEHK